jgi:GNAT superfamily N-acetyltransferase
MISDQSKKSCFSIIDLPWDSNFFGLTCKKVIIDSELNEDAINNLKVELENIPLAYIMSDSIHHSSFLLSNLGKCFLVDTAISFQIDLNEEMFSKKDTKIIDCSKLSTFQIETIQKISSNSFIESRFYKDPFIRNDKADKLYHEWLKNSIDVLSNKILLDDDLGFILFNEDTKRRVIEIELLAVEANSRGKGIAFKMISALIAYASKKSSGYKVTVETQVDNIPAMNLYIKSNFKIIKVRYIYHRWNT